MSRASQPTGRPRERLLVCGVLLPGQEDEPGGALTELRELVRAAGADPVGSGIVQKKLAPDPATLMGRGKVGEIAAEVEALRPDAVAVDNDLSPAQIRNLERALGVRVVDRSEVILDIFARRARTSQARLQVELAQAEYLLPRLRRMWTHLERTEGAIGTRGPGETQLETDKRLLRRRIVDLRARLQEIAERRQREVRSRADAFTVGLVGYTNAGKSTLFNELTGARELAADMLFATLDTRTRQWRLPDGRIVLLSDTVGFLQRLPHHLVASFHATLEETLHADLLLHVVDASHPAAAAQIAAVDRVLGELSWGARPAVLVFNKIDRVEEPLHLHALVQGRRAEIVFVSARTGEGLDRLTALVQRELDLRSIPTVVTLSLADGRSAAAVRRAGAVEQEEVLGDSELRLHLRLSPGALGNLRRTIGSRARLETLEGDSEATNGRPENDAP
jgi:GTP-binding protein HflX